MSKIKAIVLFAALATIFVLPLAGCYSSTTYDAGPSQSHQLTILTDQFPAAIVNSAYSMILEGAYGTGVYTWTISPMPSWMTLSPVGLITGTPKTAGTFNFTVTVKDTGGNTATANCSVVVS